MVKVERTPDAPPSLAVEKARGSGNYRGEDVVRQLHHDFYGKCYLCEIDRLQSVQIEHLRAHHKGRDRDLMFDWNNLFYSCGHCNNVKNQKQYENAVLDCCREEPERYLSQRLEEGHVKVEIRVSSQEAVVTARLLTECFEKRNTEIRVLECQTRIDALQETMNVLYRNLEAYKKKPTAKTFRALRGMLHRSYRFAGFTRTYVREHIEDYPDFQEFVAL